MYPVDLENCGILFCHFPGLETTGMESPGNFLKSSYKILRIYKKMFSDGKENWFTNVGNERVYGEIEALEESIWVLETSWKFVSGKGSEPCISRTL